MRNAFRKLSRTLVGSRLRTNIVASGTSTVITAGIALVGYPLYLGYLGFEAYGIWLSLSVINSVAQLGNTGFAPAVTKFVAEDLARGAVQRMTSCVSTAMSLILLLGIFTVTMSVVFSAQICSLFGLTGAALAAGEYYLPWITALSTYTLVVHPEPDGRPHGGDVR